MSPGKKAPQIVLKRAYEQATQEDGCRILVERLWPRGVSKDAAKITLWAKDAAPTTELRKWFSHDHDKWEEFKSRYFAELRANPEAVKPIRASLANGLVTFVFASKETEFNNAVALKEYLER